MLNNLANTSLIPSINSITNPVVRNTLALNQIEGFTPVQTFTDSSNVGWSLSKSCFDSSKDIPDPKSIQITDYWNHEFPNIKTKLYIYVVEGIRQPRVETERPSKVLYQWFSPVFIPNFDPTMITDREWLKANVYVANIEDTRVSKLNALCHTNVCYNNDVDNDKLLQIEGLSNGNTRSDKGSSKQGN